MDSGDRKDLTNPSSLTKAAVIQEVDELLNSGEATRRLRASQPEFDKAIARLRRAEVIDLDKLRRVIVTI